MASLISVKLGTTSLMLSGLAQSREVLLKLLAVEDKANVLLDFILELFGFELTSNIDRNWLFAGSGREWELKLDDPELEIEWQRNWNDQQQDLETDYEFVAGKENELSF